MYFLILVLPFLGFVVSGLGGRWLGYYGSSVFSTTCIFAAFVFSCLAFYEVGLMGTTCYLVVSPWVISEILNVNWGFLFDSLTVTMLVVITSISTLVHFYSISYMENDPHFPRFISYLGVFSFFMIVLVTADNLIQMFLGWEGVGLASYLLINFWFTRLAANQSAIKALVVNRIGDFGLSLGIFLIFYVFQSLDYLTIFSLTPLFLENHFIFWNFQVHSLTLAGLFLFMGAVGKSAQLGLHTWLPDAMEGPTPVSALIHAATMVTAGVFLMIRFSPLIEFSPLVLTTLIVFGSLTAFFASMTGVFQNDIKRVIAYSTCSQLGYMIFSCGMSAYNVSLFHLSNHAFFKALLFLSAGSVIHAVSDEQDMRRMGSLVKFLPLTYSVMLIGSLALTGFPFLTGFYSKDFILELSQALLNPNFKNFNVAFACWLGTMSAFFTAFYSFRLVFLTFLNSTTTSRKFISTVHESSGIILFPLVLLGLGSIFIGYLTKDLFIGLGTDFLKSSVLMLPEHSAFVEAEWLNLRSKWLPFFVSMAGVLCACWFNLIPNRQFLNSSAHKFLCFLISKKWFVDIVYNRLFVTPFLHFGYVISFKNLDRGFIELIGPFGVTKLISMWAIMVSRIQTGQITHYLFFIVIGLVSFLLILWGFISNFYLINFFLVLLFFI
uniref:NADH dehydrogenase subunit 5 n=1 Tax=Fushitsunagia catenata TaxID=1827018 RepID=UPI0026E16E8F|nr:NADH dehydrogenase subunit 5 [Fushitsunagia catenata]WJJ67933.1 NADH dehydrogenase subunit 5 [Fushitsunagia catenata]